MVDFFAQSDAEREVFGSTYSRSSKRTELLHSFVINDIKRNNPDAVIESEKEITYDFGYSKKHDIVVDDKNIVELKFVESEFDKNANNYLEGELGRSVIVDGSGRNFYSLTFIRKKSLNGEKSINKIQKYNFLKNKTVYLYDDDNLEYTKLIGDEYDEIIRKISFQRGAE